MKTEIETALKLIEETRKASGSAAAREVASAFGTYLETIHGEAFDDDQFVEDAQKAIGDDPPPNTKVPYQFVEEAMLIIAACYIHQGFEAGSKVGTGITSLFLRIQPDFDTKQFRNETMQLVVDIRSKAKPAVEPSSDLN